MASDTERIIGALNENKEAMTKRLDSIDGRITDLPCTQHLERLVRVEAKVDDLNNVKRTIRTSLLRWLIPYIMAAAGTGYAASLIPWR